VIEGVEYALSAYGCLDGADAMVLVTEWDMFRALDIATIKHLLKQPIVVGLRNSTCWRICSGGRSRKVQAKGGL
jgi:UDPglucose 6-dehydrogenase